MARLMIIIGVALGLTGCSAITDIGQFDFRTRGDLTLTLENLGRHEAERMRILVTRREDVGIEFVGTLAGVLQGVDEPDDRELLELVFPAILDEGTDYDVLLHVDLDQGDTIEAGEPVYGAQIVDGEATIRAETPGSFDMPINTLGGQFVDLQLTNFSPHIGEDIEHFVLLVIDVEEQRPVAYARLPDVPDLNFEVFLSGVVTQGRMYKLEFYVDADSNGVFSGPGNAADHSWHEERTADSDGVVIVFDHRTPFQELEFID